MRSRKPRAKTGASHGNLLALIGQLVFGSSNNEEEY